MIMALLIRVEGSSKLIATICLPGSSEQCISFYQQLGFEGCHVKQTMDTVGPTQSLITYKIQGLEIAGLRSEEQRKVSSYLHKGQHSCIYMMSIPTTDDLQNWPHLRDVDPPQIEPDLGQLIGNGLADVCFRLEVRMGPVDHRWDGSRGININRQGISQNVNVKIINHADVARVEEIPEPKDVYVKLVNSEFPERIVVDQRVYAVKG